MIGSASMFLRVYPSIGVDGCPYCCHLVYEDLVVYIDALDAEILYC